MYIYSMANQKSNQPTMTVELSLVDFCHIKTYQHNYYLPLHFIVLFAINRARVFVFNDYFLFFFKLKNHISSKNIQKSELKSFQKRRMEVDHSEPSDDTFSFVNIQENSTAAEQTSEATIFTEAASTDSATEANEQLSPEFLQRKLYFLLENLKKMHGELPE